MTDLRAIVRVRPGPGLHRFLASTLLVCFLAAILAAGQGGAGAPTAPPGTAASGASQWQSLFDGKSLRDWRETPFTGRGKVRVENESIILGAGEMTGITWTKPFPKSNYEVRLEGARLDGSDFFATITFPVKDSYCSWVIGGWGGDIVGLSSLDGWDASDNETRSYYYFDTGRFYSLRLRVTDELIQAWIDDRMIVRVALQARHISLRYGEIKLSAPFGFASYYTTGALRKMEYRAVRPTGHNNEGSVRAVRPADSVLALRARGFPLPERGGPAVPPGQ